MPAEGVGELVEVDWTALPYGVNDAIQSLLIEHPDNFYVTPGRTFLYFITRRTGLLMIKGDYNGWTDEQIGEHVFYLRRSL